MKALSIRQPWTSAILHLGKSIENRTWSTTFRGEFLLHASLGMTNDEYVEAMLFCRRLLDAAARKEHAPKMLKGALPRGGIVGVARLDFVVGPRPRLADLGAHYSDELVESGAWRWHMPEQWGFVLVDVRPLPFVPLKGALGFFDVPDDVAREALAGSP